jgi:transcriptional regulator with XRE-family HTH domain
LSIPQRYFFIIFYTFFYLNTLGDRLREYGEKNYESLKDFAKALGMAPSNLQKYLNNEHTPKSRFKKKLRAIGADVDYIIDGKSKRTLDEVGAEPVKMTDLEKESLIALIEKLKSEKANHLLLIQQLLSDKEVYEDAVKLLSAEGDAIGSVAQVIAKLKQRIIR